MIHELTTDLRRGAFADPVAVNHRTASASAQARLVTAIRGWHPTLSCREVETGVTLTN
jgi:hypothetical protein